MEQENINNIEKPKKVKREITEKQREVLAKARATRQAKKLLNIPTKSASKSATIDQQPTTTYQEPKMTSMSYQPQIQYIPQPIHIPNYNSDLVRLSDDVQFIKQHILEKRKMKEQKIKKQNSIDIDTFDDENEKLQYLEKVKSLQNNFIR